MSLRDFTRTAGKTIAPLGGAFMTSPAAGAAGQTIGLDFFSYYGLGRGGVLGDVDGKTVAEAFFFFNPELVSSVWDAARAKSDPREVAAHYAQSCAAWGRQTLAGVSGLDAFCELSDRVAQSAEPTPSSALFAGWREMALPDDPAGRAATQVVLVLRELRGGAHIEAVKRVGLAPDAAVAANSPHMFQLFGWTHEMPDAKAFEADAARAEDITDDLVAPAFETLSEDERETFSGVLSQIAAKAGVLV